MYASCKTATLPPDEITRPWSLVGTSHSQSSAITRSAVGREPQKLSIAVAKQTAFGALRRTTLCTRQRVLRGANESGDGDYESVTMGRAAAM